MSEHDYITTGQARTDLDEEVILDLGDGKPLTPEVPVIEASAEAPQVEVAPETEAEEVPEPPKPRMKYHLERPIFYPYTPGEKVDFSKVAEQLEVPAGSSEDYKRLRDTLPEKIRVAEPQLIDWMETVESSADFLSPKDIYSKFFNTPDAKLTNRPRHEQTPLYEARGRLRATDGDHIEGDAAVSHILGAMGRGIPKQSACWNTGLYLQYRPWTNLEIGLFHTALAQKTLEIGKRSIGLAYGKDEIINLEHAVHFALDHVVSCTVALKENKDFVGDYTLKDMVLDTVSCLDIPSILAGLLSVSYPNGFIYRTPCMTGMSTCTHVAEGTIKITEALHTDFSKLSPRQLNHMARREANKTPWAAMKLYQQDLMNQERTFTFKQDDEPVFEFVFHAPTLRGFFESGHRYIADMTAAVKQVAPKDIELNEKNKLFGRLESMVKLRQLSQWIKSINVVPTSKLVTSRDAIETALADLSDNVDLLIFLDDSVKEFISDATITAAGVPAYTCPTCKKRQGETEENPEGYELIPIDMLYGFFALVERRISRM